MPRVPGFKTESIQELFNQLRYAPEETRRRLINRAEGLIGEIEPQRGYPEEFIVFRVTSYRPESTLDPAVLVGEAVVADLCTFIQRLSRSLVLPPMCDSRGEALPIETLAESLHVSERTLRRYHKQGLVFHYVTYEHRPKPILSCYSGSLDAFRSRHPGLIDRAVRFSRVDETAERSIVAEAVELYQQRGMSRQAIARRLARAHGRAVETVRSMLARHEAQSGGRVFAVRTRLTERERRLIERAARFGITTREIAAHLGRSTQSIARVSRAARIERLADHDLSFIELSTFALDDAYQVILSAESAVRRLSSPVPEVDLAAWIDRSAQEDLAEPEHAHTLPRIAAFNLLKKRVSGAVRVGARDVSERDVEEIERDLRWAALLKRTLVRDAVPMAVGRVEQRLARPLMQQPAEFIRAFIATSIDDLSKVIDGLDPGAGHTLARVGGPAVGRRIDKLKLDPPTRRAGAVHGPGALLTHDPLAQVCAWQRSVELPAHVLTRIDRLDESERSILTALYGLQGERPRTPEEVALDRGEHVRSVRRILRDAFRRMRDAASRG